MSTIRTIHGTGQKNDNRNIQIYQKIPYQYNFALQRARLRTFFDSTGRDFQNSFSAAGMIYAEKRSKKRKNFADIKIILTFAVQYRGVEQLVARRAHNPEAGGSSPSPATKQDTSFEVSFSFMSIPLTERTARAILRYN